MKKKYMITFAAGLVLIVCGMIFFPSLPLLKQLNMVTGRKAFLEITIEHGGGGMPPGHVEPGIFKGKIQIVITEPFKSLHSADQAKIIKTVTTTSGFATITLPPGKYGLYFVQEGMPIMLYDRLDLTPYDIQANPGPRSERGDWYITVPYGTSTITFSTGSLPS